MVIYPVGGIKKASISNKNIIEIECRLKYRLIGRLNAALWNVWMGSLRQILLIFIAFENGVEGDVFEDFWLCGLISVNVNIFDADIFALIFV